MKKIDCLSLSLLILLVGCSSPVVKTPSFSPLKEIPAGEVYIERQTGPANWDRGELKSIPTYNPDSNEAWEVDLRSYDLSALDLSQSLVNLMFASFDDNTVWPPDDKMPPGYDRETILERGKNPGLGVRTLHESGITGQGVGIAIIDQTLLVNHQEYKDRLKWYEESADVQGGWAETSMHGPAVASIAVGKTVGVAPQADLYYIATSMCNTGGGYEGNDYACLAECVERVLEINRSLPAGEKIRVLSISVGWNSKSKGYQEIMAALDKAAGEGVFVISTSLDETHGFKFHGLGRDVLADPEDFASYEPGAFWAADFYRQKDYPNNEFYKNTLMIPMDSRTTASPTGEDDYVFYRVGGLSWSVPYLAGVYALAAQVKADITPAEFWQAALQTGRTIEVKNDDKNVPFGLIIDPVALIGALQNK